MMTEEQKQALTAFINAEKVNVPGTMKLTFHDMLRLEVYEVALAALTQPASPALNLPDERVDSGVNGRLYHNEGWNACLAEVKRLNAPHTAPIEPICATGGAVWVKVSDKRLKEISDCDGFMPENQEVFSIANELLAVRSRPIPDEFLNAQQNASGMFEISEDCMCQLLNMLCSKP